MSFPTVEKTAPLTAEELRLIDGYWRAANYLSVGQIYLLTNPLLHEPIVPEQVKPRLLGHFGTTPGLNLVYAHMNRAIVQRDLNAIYVAGPGHGGPGLVANAYLEGTYSEVYPHVTEDGAGMRELFRQFSFPGGIPSHVAPETPGSIHEGGELGYALTHAFGAAFDDPDLVVCCVVGDGEAETGPLATSWHGNKFLNPRRDGAVLPVLHLNGWKIANPTVLARIPEEELISLMEGYGWRPLVVEGDEPEAVHQLFAAALDEALDEIAAIQRRARSDGDLARPRWPMIVLRTPKGWTGPHEVDGVQVEGTWRSHQVPMTDVRTNAGPPAGARGVDAELPARGAVRRERHARAGAAGAAAARRAADEREPGHERRLRAARPRPAGLPCLRRRRRVPRRDDERGDTGARVVPPRRDGAERARPSGSSAPTRRPRTGSTRCTRRRTRPGRPRPCPSTSTFRRTAE